MKNMTLLLWAVLITFALNAQMGKKTLRLSGTIANKYPIKMTLVIDGDRIMGYYSYDHYKINILLEGEKKGNKVSLRESIDLEEDFRKGFIGTLDGRRFSGSWKDTIENKNLAFHADLISEKTVTPSEHAIRIQGSYEDEDSSTQFISSISFTYIAEDIYCFEISNGTESGCVGYLKDVVKLDSTGRGKYSKDECDLTFLVTGKDVVVNEKECGWHGYRCLFSGLYIKN